MTPVLSLPSFTGNRNNIDICLYNWRALCVEWKLLVSSDKPRHYAQSTNRRRLEDSDRITTGVFISLNLTSPHLISSHLTASLLPNQMLRGSRQPVSDLSGGVSDVSPTATSWRRHAEVTRKLASWNMAVSARQLASCRCTSRSPSVGYTGITADLKCVAPTGLRRGSSSPATRQLCGRL